MEGIEESVEDIAKQERNKGNRSASKTTSEIMFY
jgi:hypothetical protein